METLLNGYTLKIYDGCFPLSTDSMVLADFVKLPKNARILDLGAGCGTLGLLLCAASPDCRITGIEIDEASHRSALENIEHNGLSQRMESLHADLRQRALPAGTYDVCVSNPPYFSGGPAAKLVNARRTDTCTAHALFEAAARSLKFGGDFFIVHRPENLGQLFGCACAFSLEAKRLRLVRHRPGDPVSLVLIQFRKGAKPGLVWEEMYLYEKNGTPSEAHRRIYHQQES